MPTNLKLDARTRREFRRIGHDLAVVIRIGDAGLSDGVLAETDRALADHELIKVRLPASDREARAAAIEALCAATNSTLVQSLGRTALLYRRNDEPDPKKSNILRARLG